MNKVKLGDICNITTGKLDANQAQPKGKYPFFTCAPEHSFIDYYAFDDDVILLAGNNASGNFHVNKFSGKFNAYQRTYILTEKDDNNLNFIYYALRIALNKIKEQSQGSQTKFLTMPILTSISIPFFDKKTQTAIAHILSTIDDKIELNNKTNKELENLAKTIYEYWFVQFDFPNEKGKPYHSSGGKMVWNEQLNRNIPEDWSACQLKYFIKNKNDSIEPGNHLQGQFYTPIDELPKRQMSFYGGLDSKEANSSLQTYKIGDLLLGAMRVYFHRVCIAAQNAITRSTTMVLRPYNKEYLPFIYELLNQDTTIQFATKFSIGTQQPYINWEGALSDYTIILPEEKHIIEYSKIINPIIEQVFCRVKENYDLITLRDFILPLLMNGQVTVKDNESNTDKVIPFNNQEKNDQKFNLWLQKEKHAARGETDLKTLREIFDSMDDDDK